MCMMILQKVWNILVGAKKERKYTYVRYEDDAVIHDNTLYDTNNTRNIVVCKVNVDHQWRNCDIYEES